MADPVTHSSSICCHGLLNCIASFLAPNDVACGLRLINKAAAEILRDFTVVNLSQPSPPPVFSARWGAPGAMQCLTLAKRKQLLCLTAASGSLDNLRTAILAAGVAPFHEPAKAATAAGHLHVVRWLKREGWPLDGVLITLASGKRGTVCERTLAGTWAGLGSCCWSSAGAGVVRGGFMDLLMPDLLLQRSGPLQKDNVIVVVHGGDLATLKQAFSACRQQMDQPILKHMMAPLLLEAAACSPTPDWREKFGWLEAQGIRANTAACFKAAGCPDGVERLRWLHGRGCDVHTESAVEHAASQGSLASLRYLLEEMRVQLSPDRLLRAACSAAEEDRLAALEVMHAVLDLSTAAAKVPEWAQRAAGRGHQAVVAWLAETFGLPAIGLGPELFTCAATSGNLQLMAWLRERGCEWSAAAVEQAVESGCVEGLAWLMEYGCPVAVDGGLYLIAARNGDLATLHGLGRWDCPWGPHGEVFTRCVSREVPNDFLQPVLSCLLGEGCPVDWEEALAAAAPARGYRSRAALEELRTWLGEQRTRREQQQ